jgi:hypothetical protein
MRIFWTSGVAGIHCRIRWKALRTAFDEGSDVIQPEDNFPLSVKICIITRTDRKSQWRNNSD